MKKIKVKLIQPVRSTPIDFTKFTLTEPLKWTVFWSASLRRHYPDQVLRVWSQPVI